MSKSAGKKPKETSDKTKEDNFVWSDDEVQLLLEVINYYKVLKAAPLGKALDKRDWRRHLTSAFSQRLRKYTFTATRRRIKGVFKFIHFGEHFRIYAFMMSVFIVLKKV